MDYVPTSSCKRSLWMTSYKKAYFRRISLTDFNVSWERALGLHLLILPWHTLELRRQNEYYKFKRSGSYYTTLGLTRPCDVNCWPWKSYTMYYGITGCGVFKRGIRNKKGFCLRINITKGIFWILRIGLCNGEPQ